MKRPGIDRGGVHMLIVRKFLFYVANMFTGDSYFLYSFALNTSAPKKKKYNILKIGKNENKEIHFGIRMKYHCITWVY